MCHQLDFFLDSTDGWDELLWLHEQAETRALTADDKENAGWRAFQTGWLYPPQATAIHLRGFGHRLNKDYPAAIAAYREALEVCRSVVPESNDVAMTLNSPASAKTKTALPTSAIFAKPCASAR